jgi:molybdopterin synthase catalytic subunit
MNRQVTKPSFGVPSLETVSRIDDSDKVAGLEAARYRMSAKMRQLEIQFEAKASELRAAFVHECGEILGHEEAAAE